MCVIAVCSTAKMDYMAEAKKRAATHTDCEIMDVEPLRYKVPEKEDKGKAVATVLLKRKGNLPPGPRKKLIKDAFNARKSMVGLETGGELAEDAGRFVPAWRLSRETKLGTVAERREWATFALPLGVRAGFSKNSDRDIEARSNAAVVEVSMRSY